MICPSASHSGNIALRIEKMAKQIPHQKAVVVPAGTDELGRVKYLHFTFEQLDQTINRYASSLQDMGVKPGMKVLMMVKPGLDFFAMVFAIFKLGAVVVLIDPGMGIKQMLANVKEVKPEVFIAIPLAHAVSCFFPKSFASIKFSITVGKRWFWRGMTHKQLFLNGRTEFKIHSSSPAMKAAILFTSGSTGPAKGVIYEHGMFDAQVNYLSEAFGIGPGDVDLPTFPLFALFGPALGMTAIIPDMNPSQPVKANPRKLLQAIADHGITNMFASPAILKKLAEYGKKHNTKISTLKRVLSAGAPAVPEHLALFTSMLTHEDAEVFTPYGATESLPISTIGSREILKETAKKSEEGAGACVGKPLPGINLVIIEISDDEISHWKDVKQLEAGKIGEIVVSGDVVTKEYFARPEENRKAKITDGEVIWHRMGDVGWLDEEGRLWFCGRKAHRVTTPAGEMFTEPCEAIFNLDKQVSRSALVGIGPRGRQIPIICIETVGSLTTTEKNELKKRLLAKAASEPLTQPITNLLFHGSFPVDVRHNAKINRENLAVWAEGKIGD